MNKKFVAFGCKNFNSTHSFIHYAYQRAFESLGWNSYWIDNEDADRLKRHSLFDIFKEWCGEQYFSYEMKPYFSDYGSVDSKALNQDLKSDLERYLNK